MRRKLLIGLVVLIAAGTAGGAYAATQSSSNPQQAFLNDAARRLNVSPSRLRSALTGAFLDRLNAAVAAGRLTQAEANRIKQRIQQGRGFPLGPPRALRFGMGRHLGPLHAAASYLGVGEAQLLSDLRNGQTLAQVATAHGKSVSGLEQALITQAKAKVERLAAAGVITKAQARRIESRLQTRIDRLVNHGLPRFAPRFAPAPGAYGPPAGGPALGGPPPGGPAVGGPAPVPPPGA